MNIAFVLSTLRALDRVENQNFIKHGVAESICKPVYFFFNFQSYSAYINQ